MHLGAIGGFMGSAYHANAVDFNGSTDYLSRISTLTGEANSSQGIFSCWFRLDGTDGAAMGIFTADIGAGANTTFIQRDGSNKLSFVTQNIGATSVLQFKTTASFITSSTWHHLLMSWDTGFSSGSRLANLYIDGSSDKSITTDTGSSFSNNYATEAVFNIAGHGAINVFNGCLAEIYLANGQYLDFSIQGNRDKFIKNSKPVNLGPTGLIPTGVAPSIYLPNKAASVGTNAGTGGDFTINGSPVDASTSPSD